MSDSGQPVAMVIRADRSVCAGHAMCAMIGGEDLFPLDDDGFSIADGVVATAAQSEQALAGARVCPERAIRLIDQATTREIDLG